MSQFNPQIGPKRFACAACEEKAKRREARMDKAKMASELLSVVCLLSGGKKACDCGCEDGVEKVLVSEDIIGSAIREALMAGNRGI